MAKYSARSASRLATCTTGLQSVFAVVIQWWDHTILFGHRGKEDQDAAMVAGASTKPWPASKHNLTPSQAADAAPYYADVNNGGIDWRTDAELLKAAREGRFEDVKAILENIKRWYSFGGFVRGVGAAKGVRIRWGGDWDGDCRFNDHTLVDLPHFEEQTP